MANQPQTPMPVPQHPLAQLIHKMLTGPTPTTPLVDALVIHVQDYKQLVQLLQQSVNELESLRKLTDKNANWHLIEKGRGSYAFPPVDKPVLWLHPDGNLSYWEMDKDMDWNWVLERYGEQAPVMWCSAPLTPDEIPQRKAQLKSVNTPGTVPAREEGENIPTPESGDKSDRTVVPITDDKSTEGDDDGGQT